MYNFEIDSFYQYKTYGGCYESPSSEEYILKIAHDTIKKLWGTNRPIYIFKADLDKGLYPKYTNLAWVRSGPIKDKNSDGSHLIFVYWTNDPYSFHEFVRNRDSSSIESLGLIYDIYKENCKDYEI